MSATSANQASPSFVSEPGPPGTRFVEIRRFDSLDSTNRYLADEAIAGAREGLVAVTSYQSAGRGRLGRRWEAPPGTNLLASVLFRPRLEPEDLHLLTVVVAMAAADTCAELVGLEPRLKWPNDLHVGTRKLAGILAESVPDRPGEAHAGLRRAVVVGLGLNVLWPPPASVRPRASVPHEIESIATSLWRECAIAVPDERLDARLILGSVLASLDHRVEDLAHGDGRSRQAAEYRRRCDTVGKRVKVSLGEETVEGIAEDVTDVGHLVVRCGATLRTVVAGDVVHID